MSDLAVGHKGAGGGRNEMPHRTFPCRECPWRRDTPPGQFPAARFEALRNTSGRPGAEACMSAPMFGCHKGEPGPDADLARAGWLAAVGRDHLGVRVAVAFGHLPATALDPGPGWPELFESYDEMAAVQGAPKTEGA